MNKKYLYTFLIAFAVTMAVILGVYYKAGLFAFQDVRDPNRGADIVQKENGDDPEKTSPTVNPNINDEEKVVNVLAFGLNDGLADTIVLFSYNYGTNRLNILSVPRDTYHEVRGYPETWQHKINSVYTYREDGGPIGMKTEVSKLLGIPIHYYIKVDFASVVSVVDTLGGYEVYVPYHMKYDDFYAYPELHIDIPEGWNNLDGQGTLKFLRFRQNNDGTISEGDIVRTQRQRDFINAMIEKAINSGDILSILKTIIKEEYVATDIPIEEVVKYATFMKKLPMDRVHSYLLQGYNDMIDGLSFWIPDLGKKDALMRAFYSKNPNEVYQESADADDKQ